MANWPIHADGTGAVTLDAPMHALLAPSPDGLSRDEKLVWILGDLMNAVENYFGTENPKRLGHINAAAIRIIDEILTPRAGLDPWAHLPPNEGFDGPQGAE